MPDYIDPQGRHIGRLTILYASETAPPDGSELDPASYERVGLLASNTVSINGENVTPQDKETDFWNSSLVTGANYEVPLEGNRPITDDPGLALIRQSATTGSVIYWLRLTLDPDTDTALEGSQAAYGQAQATSYEEEDPADDVATYSATLVGQGPLTYETIQPAA